MTTSRSFKDLANSCERTKAFAEITGATLKTLQRGGHISSDYITRKYWPQIKKFFGSARD